MVKNWKTGLEQTTDTYLLVRYGVVVCKGQLIILVISNPAWFGIDGLLLQLTFQYNEVTYDLYFDL